MPISEDARQRISGLADAAQIRFRIPSLVVAVAREGEMLFSHAVGSADFGRKVPASAEVQYRIGSITKTVTAVAIMQLAEQGLLEVEDPIGQSWPGAPHGEMRVADLMAHSSGLQREPVGEVWETLQFPTTAQLSENASQAKLLYPPRIWWHYSNLGFALLGELAARLSGRSWEELVRQAVLGPAGMERTTMAPRKSAAQGYSVHPYSGELIPEEPVDCLGIAPAGQLWSTAADLCRWTGVLAGSVPEVLSGSALERMRAVRIMADVDRWSLAFGLGLMLSRRSDRVVVGHTGSMPGFRAAIWADPTSKWGVVLLSNTPTGARPGVLAGQIMDVLLGEEDGSVAWAPGEPVPSEVAPLLGQWWSEWSEWVFSWKNQRLQGCPVDNEEGDPPTVFESRGLDRFVASNGAERGEELVLVRGPDGGVVGFHWATYPFRRDPQPFAPGPS